MSKSLIPTSKAVSQTLNTEINNHSVYIELISVRGLITALVSIDDVAVSSGVKCSPGCSITTSDAEKMLGGRLYFETNYGEYPTSDIIGTDDCSLIYEES